MSIQRTCSAPFARFGSAIWCVVSGGNGLEVPLELINFMD